MLNILGMNHHDQWLGLQGSGHLGAVIDSACTLFSTPQVLQGQGAFLGCPAVLSSVIRLWKTLAFSSELRCFLFFK
jgi:hypothetical protein